MINLSRIGGFTNLCFLVGNIVLRRAPWLKDIWFIGSSYIIPNVDTVVLGGTAEKGNWSTTVSLKDTETILANIAKVFPSIYDAPIVSTYSNSLYSKSNIK